MTVDGNDVHGTDVHGNDIVAYNDIVCLLTSLQRRYMAGSAPAWPAWPWTLAHPDKQQLESVARVFKNRTPVAAPPMPHTMPVRQPQLPLLHMLYRPVYTPLRQAEPLHAGDPSAPLAGPPPHSPYPPCVTPRRASMLSGAHRTTHHIRCSPSTTAWHHIPCGTRRIASRHTAAPGPPAEPPATPQVLSALSVLVCACPPHSR